MKEPSKEHEHYFRYDAQLVLNDDGSAKDMEVDCASPPWQMQTVAKSSSDVDIKNIYRLLQQKWAIVSRVRPLVYLRSCVMPAA